MLSAINSARGWSWLLASLSIALPSALFLQQQRSFAKWTSQQEGFVCGMPLLAALLMCALLSFGLSLCALLTGWSGYKELPAPRARLRLLEVLFVGSIFVVGLLGFAGFSLASLWA